MTHPHLRRIGVLAAFVLCASLTGPAHAWTNGVTNHYYSSHPMISGTVASVNDRQLVVNTDQGEQVTLIMDSHTMAFRDLAAGMTVRVDFAAHENCRLFAERVWAVREDAPAAREQAYANTRGASDARRQPASGARSSAAAPSPGMNMDATRASLAWQTSVRPMISGRVVSANDHQLIVDTDQGQRVGVVMDSHTLVPGEVGPGVAIRAQYRHLDDGRYLAQRIHAVEESAAEREQAYAHSRDRNVALDPATTDCGYPAAPPARESVSRPAPPAPAPPAPAPPAPKPEPTPAPPPPAPSKTERALVETGTFRLENVYFETAKSTLLPESRETLDEAGAALEKHPELKVEVGGHTDSRGSREMNVRLSQARAESVRQYLLDHFKIAPGSLTAKGYGPPADGKVEKTDAQRQANRRVELKVVK